MLTKTLRLMIDSQLENVFLVGLAVRAICSHLSFDEIEVYQIEVSVVEGVNNAIKHAYHDQSGHEVEIIVSLHPDRITFEVCDTGEEMKAREVTSLHCDPKHLEEIPESGRGLSIIRAVMDKVTYERMDRRNVLAMTKYLGKKNHPL